MANYKSDIKFKLENEKAKVLENAPDFLKIYINRTLALRDNETRTHTSYAKSIMIFLEYLCRDSEKKTNELTIDDLKELKEEDIYDFIQYLTCYTSTFTSKNGTVVKRIRTNSNTSKATKLAALKKFFHHLYKKGYINSDICKEVQVIKPDVTKLSNKLEGIEINEITNEIKYGTNVPTHLQKKAFDRLKIRDMAIFYLLSYTGIRVSELVSLDINDVNLTKCTITVTRKNNKIQEIPYPSVISDYIADYIKYRKNSYINISDEYKKALFLSQHKKRISEQSVRILLKKYADRINIDDIACHTFRRSFLSAYYNKSKDIRATAKIGGHSVATASKYYADVNQERLRDEVSRFTY